MYEAFPSSFDRLYTHSSISDEGGRGTVVGISKESDDDSWKLPSSELHRVMKSFGKYPAEIAESLYGVQSS